mgnify:CR=1 FL=1
MVQAYPGTQNTQRACPRLVQASLRLDYIHYTRNYFYIITEGCESRRLGQLQALDIDEGNNAEITYFVNGNE